VETPGERCPPAGGVRGAGDRVGGADGEAGGEDGLVVELGDEALVEVAEAVDEVVVARLGGDDLDAGDLLAQEAADAHQGARRTQSRHEVVMEGGRSESPARFVA